MKTCLVIIIMFGIISCNEVKDNLLISPITEDFSSIENPKQRWQAYQLKNYYVEETWSCECLPPSSCKTYIIDSAIDKVEYEIINDSYYGRTEEEIYNQTKKSAMTIDEAFDLIEQYENNAHVSQIEYDQKFGYPTKIYFDIDTMIADEEIIRTFSSLQEIVK